MEGRSDADIELLLDDFEPSNKGHRLDSENHANGGTKGQLIGFIGVRGSAVDRCAPKEFGLKDDAVILVLPTFSEHVDEGRAELKLWLDCPTFFGLIDAREADRDCHREQAHADGAAGGAGPDVLRNKACAIRMLRC